MQSAWTDNLDAKQFYLEMLANLTSSLERVIGCEDAEGYLALVGAEMGHDLFNAYSSDLEAPDQTLEKIAAVIAAVLVDLKTHIEGGFAIEAISDGKITLTNTRCPFGEKALGRRSLCMMTSSVFGTISSEAAGQANVDIQKSIAAGDGCCRVIVYLNQPDAPGKRYFGRSL